MVKMKLPGISCAVIGEGNLLLCCLKDLLDKNITIKAVFSNTECAGKFCDDHDILYNKRNADIADVIGNSTIDYLFSVSNPRILKERELNIPRKLTINFHDSPLPAYAGVHATSWAIMRGEHKHGISWHVVEVGIDTGDILQSEDVDILEDDSALTLNLKCVEAAKCAFKRLLNDIINDELEQRKQADVGRTYFGLYAIPPNVGILKFNENADTIYDLTRGLEFGNHENALGSPKIKTTSGEFFLVTNVSKSNEFTQTNQNRCSEAGTIIDAIDDTFIVATNTTPIEISVAHLHGAPITESSFRTHGLTVGAKLVNNLQIDVDEILTCRKKESFWRSKMFGYEPTMFYRQKMNVVANIIDVSTDFNIQSVKLQIPCLELDKSIKSDSSFLQACFVAFLSRIICTSSVHIGMIADKTSLPLECRALFTEIVPAVFTVHHNCDIKKVLEECVTVLQKHTDAITFPTDMFYRYPELRGHKRTPHHNFVIGRKMGQTTNNDVIKAVLHDCNMLLLFTSENREIELLYHERPAQDFGHVIDVLQHFPTFVYAVNRCKPSTELKCISMVSKNEMNLFYQPPISSTISNEITIERITDLVQMQCRLTPLSIAIKTSSHVVTYNRLLEDVNKLSKLLIDVLPPSNGTKGTVALYMPNSVTYIVAILALSIQQSAFLPLPIDSPVDRLVFTLQDANVKRIIMTRDKFDTCDLNGLTSCMSVILKHKVAGDELVLVEFDKEFHTENTLNETTDHRKQTFSNADDSDFIYLMYTSGSTGRPKGIKVKESSVVNLARAQIMEWDICPGDVIAQFASIGFDATISEIFTSLLSGASLAILGSTERLGSNFLTAMNKMKVSVITLPPSALNIYSPADLPSLKKVITAGEACTLNTAVKWASEGQVRFFNAYGPTEATVCATCFEYQPGTIYEDVNRELPIGKAISGAHVYLFDDFMNAVPPDVVGEIYIGGKGLAHGYIGHASHFTSERFVQNPLTNETSLLYKTGDHAFQDKFGNITYIGRLDDQVKIRGHRIDLSEIEQVLIQHPKIEMAVVVVHKCGKTNELSIAAFVAPTFIYLSELREYLAKVIPKYMVPTYIKKLEISDLPKTLNGKINRKQLEQDESIHDILKVDGHSHLNETQLFVARHWCTVFKMDESFIYSLHRQSSFGELGGNSLQLVLLLRLIEDELHIEISFTDLGTADTIEEFAEVIRRRRDIKRKCEHSDVKTKEELRELIFQDSELDSSFLPHPDRRRSVQFAHYTTLVHKITAKNHPKNILLSGVTGFLGAFLLFEILEQTNSHVCCMVRETTEVRGMGRIIENMRKYGIWKFEYSSRIAVVISDLSQKNMGIAPDIYKSLCNAIDMVFMNAAMMNFNTPYEDHRLANVEGTKEFIKFASTGVQKYMFTTSSLSVFLFPPVNANYGNNRQMYKESDFLDDPLLIEGGYGQSKWASERLVMQALDFLPGGAIFRPARVTGRSTDGVGPMNDLFASTMIGMKRLGAYPDMDFPYDLTPVDFCAKSMIEVSLKICNAKTNTTEKVYHLFNANTIPFKDLFGGMGLEAMSLEEWRKALKHADESNKELIPLTPFFLSHFWDKAPNWPVFDTRNIDNAISDSTKDLKKPTAELLKVYKTYFGV